MVFFTPAVVTSRHRAALSLDVGAAQAVETEPRSSGGTGFERRGGERCRTQRRLRTRKKPSGSASPTSLAG